MTVVHGCQRACGLSECSFGSIPGGSIRKLLSDQHPLRGVVKDENSGWATTQKLAVFTPIVPYPFIIAHFLAPEAKQGTDQVDGPELQIFICDKLNVGVLSFGAEEGASALTPRLTLSSHRNDHGASRSASSGVACPHGLSHKLSARSLPLPRRLKPFEGSQ